MALEPVKVEGQEDPNALIAKQFAASRKNLAGQKVQAMDQMNADVQRQQALTGLSGGNLLKAKEKAQRNLEEGFASQEAQLGAAEAQTGLQESQYERNLSQQANQFKQQMQYSWAELDENKKTNLINAISNLAKLDYKDSTWDRVMKQFGSISKGPDSYTNLVQPAKPNSPLTMLGRA